MTLPVVERALGTKFPDKPEDLAVEYKKVIGPVIAELRKRFNELQIHIGWLHAADTDAIEELDTTGMAEFTVIVDEETGDVYSLDTDGTPGAGDLSASPTGAWMYAYSL